MLRYKFKNNEDIAGFLGAKTLSTTEEMYAEIYQDTQGVFHLLGSMEERPENTPIYSLSEKRYFEFHDQFNPTAEPDADYAEDITHAIHEAHLKIIYAARAVLGEAVPELTESEKAAVIIATNKLDNDLKLIEKNFGESGLRNELLKEYLSKLPRNILKTIANLPTPASHQLSENKVSAIQAAQDAIWMAQSSITADFLKYAGTKTATALAASTKTIGIAFGVASGALMGIGCGILSAKIYESRAVKSFTEKNKRAPNNKELKLIQRDAKHVGHSVFYGMTFWSLFAGLMECSLEVAKVAANFHPVGLAVNILISLASGIGQAVGTCTQHFAHEREKHAANWDQYKQSGEFIKSMIKVAVTSFFTGFAWSMISSFVPAPLKHALQTSAEKVAKIFIKMAYRAVSAGLATFGITLIASKTTRVFEKTPILNFLKKPRRGNETVSKEKEDDHLQKGRS